MSTSPPTLIFIPGTWHKPSCYHKIISILSSSPYNLECIPITLPSTQGDPSATFKNDIDAARTVIAEETSAGRDVVVISHSYGGMVGNSCVRGFTRTSHVPVPKEFDPTTTKSSSHEELAKSQDGNTQRGHVIGQILIASGFTLTGLSFMDPFFGHAPPQWKPNWTTGFADIVLPPSQCFYHDVDPSELPQLIQDLAPQSLKTMYEGGEHAYSGWRDVPTWYLGTTEDMGLPIFAQRMQVGMVRGMDGDVVHREVRSSHSPFLSMKRETSRVVGDAVGAFMGRRVGGEEDREIINRIVVPEVSLWRLPSWWWYGVPYGMGWGIGKVVLVVQWVTGWGR